MFRLETLGACCVKGPDGRSVPFRSRKHFALLAYLGCTAPRAHRRERLVGLLWPDDTDARARHSLSQALYALRRALGDGVLTVRGEELQWGPAAPGLDVAEFETHIRAGRWDRAVELYRGEFLEGFWVRNARPFEEWMDRERARLGAEYRQALRALIRRASERGDWATVLDAGRRLVHVEPYDEHAHADVMRALWIAGDRAGALRQYEVLRDTLARELETEPGVEIRELAARIRRRAAEAERKEDERKAGPATSEPPFLGRAEEYGQLVALWEQVKTGTAAAVVLTGEPGIGKTRLAEEFLKFVALEDAVVLRGNCYPFLQGVPYAPFAEALRPACTATVLGRLDPRWTAELGRLFPEMIPEPPSDEFARNTGVRVQFEAVAQLLDAVCADRPVVVRIDNLQWADAGSSSLAYFLPQRLRDRRLLMIVTTREDHPHAWLEWPAGEGVPVLVLRLPPLSRADVERLVRSVHGDLPGEHVHVVTRGNPFFALELCRAPGGYAGSEAGRPPAHVDVTAGVRPVIERRLSLLEPRTRRVLEAAAVIGAPVPVALLGAITGAPRPVLTLHVEKLAQDGFVIAKGEQLEFAHDLVHETVYSSLPDVRRRTLHGRVAALLRRHESAEARAKQAWHYDRAGDAERAFETALSAARAARERHAYEQASVLAEIAVRNATTSPQRLEALYLLGESLVSQRRYAQARPVLEQCRALAIESGDREAEIRAQNLLWRTQLDWPDHPLDEVLRSALRVADEPWFPCVSVQAQTEFAMVLVGAGYRAGDVGLMQRGCDLAERLAAQTAEPVARATALRARGVLAGIRGDRETALDLLRRRVELARKTGWVEELHALMDLAVVLAHTFTDLETAAPVHQRAIELATRLGDPLLKGQCHNNWGAALLDWGLFDKAQQELERVMEVVSPYTELGLVRAVAATNLAELAWLRRDPETAEVYWRTAQSLAHRGHTLLYMNSMAGLGLCAVLRGDIAKARQCAVDAIRASRICRSAIAAEFHDVTLLRAALLLNAGRMQQAARIVSEEYDRCRELRPANCLKLLAGAARLFRMFGDRLGQVFGRELLRYATDLRAVEFQKQAESLLSTFDGADADTMVLGSSGEGHRDLRKDRTRLETEGPRLTRGS